MPSSAGMRAKKRWSAVCATEPRCIASGSASIVLGREKPLDEPGGGAVGEALELGHGERGA